MALRGHHHHHHNQRKRKVSVLLGRCELCDVDFTSQTQKESHMAGKKHAKNVRLVDIGQPPKKRQKTNYFNSLHKNIKSQQQQKQQQAQQVQHAQESIENDTDNHMNETNIKTEIVKKEICDNNSLNGADIIKQENIRKLKPHEILQKNVETLYREYTQIAKNSDSGAAQKLYTKYQETYEEYIKEYHKYAQMFNNQRNDDKDKNENVNNNKTNLDNHEDDNDDDDDDDDYDLKTIPKKKIYQNYMAPTITTISTVSESKSLSNETNEDDD